MTFFSLSGAYRVLTESTQIVLGMQDEVGLAEKIKLSLWKILKRLKDGLN